jgi:hypothetical protein
MGLISNGTTIFDNGSMASGFGSSLKFISSATASASTSIEFSLVNYKEYKFFFVNIHPSSNGARLSFNLSTDGGSNYNVTKTSSAFKAYHKEDGSTYALTYDATYDLAQSTAFENLSTDLISNNDSNASGVLTLFNPSSTTYVKQYIATSNGMTDGSPPYSEQRFKAGYANTTSALTNIKFQMDSGNIDDGKILMFGVN